MSDSNRVDPPAGGSKSDSSNKESQKLFYVHIPQDSTLDPSRVLLKSRTISNPSQPVSFSAKISSFPSFINAAAKDSKTNFRDISSMESLAKLSKISTVASRTNIGAGLTLQGTSQNISQKTGPSNALPMRPLMKSPITVTLTNNRAVATVLRSTSGLTSSTVVITPARNSISVPPNSGITLVSSGSTSMTPTVCSPSQIRASTPTQVLAKPSKPLILHPKILTGSKKDVTNTKLIPQKLLPLVSPVRTIVPNKAVVSYGPILQADAASESSFNVTTATANVLKKESLSRRDGYFNSFTPPPLILQAGSASVSKSVHSKSGTTTISIVTGKSSGSPGNVSVVPLQRNQNAKPNMMNFKITNGQIQRDNTVKIDSMLLEPHPVMVADSSLKPNLNVQETQFLRHKGIVGKIEDTSFYKSLSKNIESNKDILQEAMSAVTSDLQDDNPITATEQIMSGAPSNLICPSLDNRQISEAPKKQTVEIREAYPVVVTRHISSTTNIIPVMVPVSGAGMIPMVAVSSSPNRNVATVSLNPLPISDNSNLSTSTNPSPSKPDLPGLIIRTDSVTVRRKIIKEEEKKEIDDQQLEPQVVSLARDNVSEEKLEELQATDFNSFDEKVANQALIDTPNDATQPAKLGDLTETPSIENSVQVRNTNEALVKPEKLPVAKENSVSNLLEWQNGTATLTGTELKLRMNEFNAIEIIEDKALEKMKGLLPHADTESSESKPSEGSSKEVLEQAPVEQQTHIHHARKPSFKGLIRDDSSDYRQDSEGSSKSGKDLYDICCCKNCGCYGLSSEFHKEKDNNFCTLACSADYELKENEWNKERIRMEKQKRNKKSKASDKDIQEIKLDDDTSSTDVLNGAKDSNISNIKGVLPSAILSKFVHPWTDSRDCFSWVRYLEFCGKNKGISKAAPLKLWSEPFPYGKNLFKPGMKLEGVDPQHQSLICVMTVMDIIGYRIRLHFDGYSEMHDFWCNADSPFLFQVGWCEKNGRKLETPPGIVNFSWKLYLEHCKAQSAPRQGFSTKNSSNVSLPNNFRIGMKLEAEDRKNRCVCVATVTDVLDNRILVHYDGWDKAFDTWFEVNSPYIHPIGWCQENDVELYPPQNYPNQDSFNWPEYLLLTASMAVPARAFRTRAPKEFKSEMKLEAVDKRNSMLIRVTTIAEVKDYKIKLHFDGWDEMYDYWVDDDFPGIHPPSWCSKTGHPLQPPLTPEQCAEDVDSGVTCGTPGCKGFGHIKGLIYNTHHTAFGCPYSPLNINKDLESLIPDRLEAVPEKKRGKSKKPINLDASQPEPVEPEEETQKKRVRKRRKFFDELSPPEVVKAKMPRVASDDSIKTSTVVKSVTVSPSLTSMIVSSCPTPQVSTVLQPIPLPPNQGSLSMPGSLEDSLCKSEPTPTRKELNVDTWVHQSIFNPGYNPRPKAPLPQSWKRHKHIIPALENLSKLHPGKWTSRDIGQIISKIPGCESSSSRLIAQDVDGESLLLVTQNDLVDLLQIKLGPAIKIMTVILHLKSLYGS